MASLDIPSLPSADINNMINYIVRQSKKVWAPNRLAPVSTSEEITDGDDRSPEPRTPRFGVSSTPTFEESNAHFGFRFPRPDTRPPESVVGADSSTNVPVTNVSLFVSETDSAHGSVNSRPQSEAMEAETTVTGSHAQYLVVQEDDVSSTNYQSPHIMNIPTTVLDKVGENTRNRPFRKMDPNELPQIMLTGEDGKPSFIRFLNDPIPLPIIQEQYFHQEVDIDKYRKPVGDTTQTDPSGPVDHRVMPVDHRVIADIDAIQRMEQEPAYPEVSSGLFESTTDQCVPPSDHSSSSDQSHYSGSEDSSSTSGSYYHPDSDVAAYQSVEDTPTYPDTPTYTELTTRQPPPPVSYPQRHGHQPDTITHSTESHFQAESYAGEFNVEHKTSLSPSPVKTNILLKSLQKKIQLKRLQEGKGELKVSFEDRPFGEPSEEEKEKAQTRKMKNRESAVKSRDRRQKQMVELEKEVKQLDRENKQLMREIEKLKNETTQLSTAATEYGCLRLAPQTPNFNQQTNLNYTHGGDHHLVEEEIVEIQTEQSSSRALSEAITNFLTKESNT